jgi:lysyl-tRNA synthetase class 1
MSSSRGLGASARDMADLLPPEVLRFLMIRTKPNSPVNFDAHEEGIVKLFNEFDRYHARVREKIASTDEAAVYRLAETRPEHDYQPANFQLVTALAQLPHLDPEKEIAKRRGGTLTEEDQRRLRDRLRAARVWVERFAGDEEKTRLQETLPPKAQELSIVQRGFLQSLAAALPETPWEDEALQAKVFEAARMTPIEQPLAFKAIYRVLLDRDAGPKAGNLLAFLDREFVVRRFQELPVEQAEFWRATAISAETLEQWLAENREKIASYSVATRAAGEIAVIELTAVMKDGKRMLRRILAPLDGGAGLAGRFVA